MGTQLFIGNLKRQTEQFAFRLGTEEKVYQFPIGPGGQIPIPLNLDDGQIQSIIQQHERYGMVGVGVVSKIPMFAGLCYSIGKPIPMNKIMEGFEINDEHLMRNAEQIRQDSAAAAQAKADEMTQGTLHTFQQEVVELPGTQGADPAIDETVEVLKADQPVPPNSGRAQARGRRTI